LRAPPPSYITEGMESKRVQTWFFAGLFVLLFLIVARIFRPFFTVILWSTLLYVLFSPLYHKILKGLDLGRRDHRIVRNVLAGVFSIGSVIVFVVPLCFVVVQLGRQISALIPTALAFLDTHPEFFSLKLEGASELLRDISFGALDLSSIDLKQEIANALSGGVATMVHLSTQFVRNVGFFVGGVLFMVFTLFFFYLDGDYLLSLFVRAVPIRNDYARQLIVKFRDITRNLFLGYILVALVQAVVAYAIFRIFSVQGSLVFAILLLFCSFIPMIGAGSVWLPLGLFRIITGDLSGGLLFLALCAVFVSTLDNFLRPLFLKDRIKLHPLIIFFSILGGIAAFGFNGLILGPMAVIFFLTVLDLFLTEHGIEHER